MTKSQLPPGMKIRVLTTIENGKVQHETIGENQIFATIEEFVDTSHHLGLLVSREMFEREWADALSQVIDARELLLQWCESLTIPGDIERAHEIIELMIGAISSLREIKIGE